MPNPRGSPVRFNEASALQRRKPSVRLGRKAIGVASMRPPLFSGGNAARPDHPAARRPASMRPPLFSGGNVAAAVPADNGLVLLQ